MKLKELGYRDTALKQLKEYFYRLLPNSKTRNKIIFKAPTGSGKTVTMACFLRDLVNELPNKFDIPNRQVAYVWIAPNQLHLQSYKSLKGFYEETRDIHAIQFEDITEDKLKPNEMLFLNWQSISSDDNIYVAEGETEKSLYTFIENTKESGTEVVVIIDEAHLFGTKGLKAQKVLDRLKGKIEIDVSATPLTDSDYKVVIEREDVVKEQMIKKGVILNPHLDKSLQGDFTADLVLLKEALKKREELSDKYKSAGTKINPLLLIQLPNDSSEKLSEKDNQIKELVVEYLKTQGINQENHRLAVWLSGKDNKINLKDIEAEDSVVEVLLFKQAIALGWDCPRASVLLIYREIKQETFTVQTLGRILRMPEQKFYSDDALNIGYVFTNLQNEYIKIEPDETDYVTFKQAKRKAEYKNINLPAYYKESNINRNRIGLYFREALFDVAQKEYGVSQVVAEGESFYHANAEKMKAKGVEMNVTAIQIEIPSDVNLDVTEVAETHVEYTAKFAKTTFELEQMFNRFCFTSCGEYAKDGSWERIKYHLKLFFEEYFGLGEGDTYKLVLHNQQKFTDLLNLSREEYGRLMEEKAKQKVVDVKEQVWEVPEFRIYNNAFVDYSVERHILDPLFLKQNTDFLSDSKNEFKFITFLEENRKEIIWWYKNGAGNRNDFAVPYVNTQGEKSLFFVDFVVLFKNGTLGLFDPKTPESDKDMISKHNSLIEYISQRGNPTVGGVVINKDGSWRFSKKKIENSYDVTGWDVLSVN